MSKTIMIDPDTGEWLQVWNSENYDDLNEYLDELWDSYVDIEEDCN